MVRPEEKAQAVSEKVDQLRLEISQVQRQDPARARELSREATAIQLKHALEREQPLFRNPFQKDDGDVKQRFIRVMTTPADAQIGVVDNKQMIEPNTKVGPFDSDSVRIIVMREGYETRDMRIDLSAIERGGERRVNVELDAIHKIQSESGVPSAKPAAAEPAPPPVPAEPASSSPPLPSPPLSENAETMPPPASAPHAESTPAPESAPIPETMEQNPVPASPAAEPDVSPSTEAPANIPPDSTTPSAL
ncbi:hypothetical protein QQ054_09500 [Oscillatoria amoena NRMC-F 0135]|nr:hypothetical protein [Oscillatoria amoena NRMC-F 0135]